MIHYVNPRPRLAPAIVLRSSEPWNTSRVLARMSEAMGVLRLVGSSMGPSRQVTWWPDLVRSSRNGDYGDERPSIIAPKASPRDVARMEEVEAWISKWLSVRACERIPLPPDTGWVVTCRAMGWPYARIGKRRKELWGITHGRDATRPRLPGGNSRPALASLERRGLLHLATQLNNSGIPVDPDTLSAA
jgi:hypothetical protein